MTVPDRNWRKASCSTNTDNCVEVALDTGEVGVRDTKDRAGGELAVESLAWRTFTSQLGR